jgi:uncharacterized 2Fe-2S/4Fe-4S cluster protein (DUF4445 family)
MTQSIQVVFEPIGRRVRISQNETCLVAAQKAGIDLIAVCNGQGTCHQCLIRLIRGELDPPTVIEKQALSSQKIGSGLRLACQATPISDVTIEVPPESISSSQRLQLEGFEVDLAPDPAVTVVELTLAPKPGDGHLLESEGVAASLKTIHPSAGIPLPVMEQLSTVRIGEGRQVRLALHESGVVTGVLASGQRSYGLAVDIGTTKLAAYLVDLENGQTIAKSGAANPQISYGEDVISRIAHANRGMLETETLQQVLMKALNRLVGELCRTGRIESHQIVDAVVVGNTAMHHLFAGLPTRQLGEAPYVPAVSAALIIPVSQLGLNLAPGVQVYLPPNIAGFVGADHVSADLACGLTGVGDNTLLVDIGTNTEITLRTPEGLSCCSCASGPAFEGAHIHAGMRAAPGAIERVTYHEGIWNYQTIDGKPPIGICGSGILDAVAEMRRAGTIDDRGVLQAGASGVERLGQGQVFRLVSADPANKVDGIHITRRDVNEIQLAKAAIRAGIEILLREHGTPAQQVTKFIVAGAFGSYINLASAMAIGMFPELPEERFFQVGNAAGAGARMMLVSKKARRVASELQEHMQYVELTTCKDFQDIYLAALPISPRLSFPAA